MTEGVLEEVRAWQSRSLDAVYPIVYLDALVVKIKENKQVINKAIYLALGLNCQGSKEVLGMWVSQNEDAVLLVNTFLTYFYPCLHLDAILSIAPRNIPAISR